MPGSASKKRWLPAFATCFGVNTLAGDQYMAIVLPGRMFRDEYARRGLHAKNLSRALEDSGTLTSPLIPWSTCGALRISRFSDRSRRARDHARLALDRLRMHCGPAKNISAAQKADEHALIQNRNGAIASRRKER